MVMAAQKSLNAPSNVVDLATFRALRHPGAAAPAQPQRVTRTERAMLRPEADDQAVLVTSVLESSNGFGKTTYSFVLPTGDIHHFYPLSDGVHHSFSRKYRGRFESALIAQLERPGARIAGRFAEELVAGT